MAIDPTTLALSGTLSRLVAPLIKDLYSGAKKFGASGLEQWKTRTIHKKVGERIQYLEQVRTLWRPDENTPLRDFFHPPKLVVNKTPKFITTLSSLPEKRIIIEGIVGQGKSIFLRSLISEDIRNNNGRELPIFIELKNLSQKNKLNQEVIKQLERYHIDYDDSTIEYLYSSGKVSLLLDGFDELEELIVKETFHEIEHLALKYEDLRIVITSRPNHEIQKSPFFTKLEIARLQPAEYPAFLSKLQLDPKKSLAIRQAIANSPSQISDLITTPLMLTLVVWVYQSESQIPETIPEFFDELFRVVFTKHDKSKPTFERKHHSGLSERQLQRLFEAFCFATIEKGYGRTISNQQFYNAFDRGVTFSGNITCEADNFKLDITKVACLMQEEGTGEITFLHKSILEYYASSFIKQLGEDNAIKFYTAIQTKTRPWLPSLSYLNSIDKFRFSKYYLLPTIDNELNLTIRSLQNLSGSDLISKIIALYPNLCVYISASKEEKSVSHIRGYGLGQDRENDHLGNFGFLILDALSKTMPQNELVETIEKNFMIKIESDSDSGWSKIPGAAVFNKYGVDELKKAIGIYESRLDRLKTEAQDAINSETQRMSMFDQIL